MLTRLQTIIAQRQLRALFQPIVDMQAGQIIGYEGLIRGPQDCPLHAPLALFEAARLHGLSLEVERLCCRTVLLRFAELGLQGKLFLNVSPECLLALGEEQQNSLNALTAIGLDPRQVVIELTENQPTYDYERLRKAVKNCRELGFQIAIDDLGEGFSSLRLWSELRPEYVKIDMHFIQGIHSDPVKMQFVRSIQEIAAKSATAVIAEGIETRGELLLIRDLGIAYGQGYHIARPHADPAPALTANVAEPLSRSNISLYPKEATPRDKSPTAARLLRHVTPATQAQSNNHVYEMFAANAALDIIPVVDDGIPIGLITRSGLIDRFARPYQRELYGKKSCALFMDTAPLIADQHTRLQDLSQIIVEAERHHMFNGFIITDHGRYLGMGTAHDLMREITQMQISAARYANPLTLLPGNVPIDEHIARLLQCGVRFAACYVDIDNFKPFNDVYGYRKGDDIIQQTARLLSAHADPERDFVGHIGGDDFIILFQNEDWELRCAAILAAFAGVVPDYYDAATLARGGYLSLDRRGHNVFHPLISLSLGVVRIDPAHYRSHHEIAAAATDAKTLAKKIPGNSLFVNRRARPTGIEEDRASLAA